MPLLRTATSAAILGSTLLIGSISQGALAQDDVTVIELTQTGCQFIESEGGFRPTVGVRQRRLLRLGLRAI